MWGGGAARLRRRRVHSCAPFLALSSVLPLPATCRGVHCTILVRGAHGFVLAELTQVHRANVLGTNALGLDPFGEDDIPGLLAAQMDQPPHLARQLRPLPLALCAAPGFLAIIGGKPTSPCLAECFRLVWFMCAFLPFKDRVQFPCRRPPVPRTATILDFAVTISLAFARPSRSRYRTSMTG